jgi:hypothetical protein
MEVVGASQGFRGAYIFDNGVKAAQIPAGYGERSLCIL